MQGMYSSAVEPTIEGIIRTRMSQVFNNDTFRDIYDDLSVILGDNLLRYFISENHLIIEYKDHLRNKKGYKIDINDFRQ